VYKNQNNKLTFAPRLKKRETQRVSIKNEIIMTKAEIVNQISESTGVEKVAVQAVVEAMMKNVKDSLSRGENVYLRGFGSFIIKKRAEKKGRNISKNTTIIIPAHNIPSFKPAKVFMEQVKKKVK
jgi:DNA-binding protein HU-beta